MPWQEIGSRRYYYRCMRRHGRPIRQYVGTGQVAELAATEDARRRVEREIEARNRLAEQARLLEGQEPLVRLCQSVEVVARAALTAAGYHRHQRGEWRHRHGGETNA
jgi:hypothetical protein